MAATSASMRLRVMASIACKWRRKAHGYCSDRAGWFDRRRDKPQLALRRFHGGIDLASRHAMAFAAKLELLDHDLPRALHGLTRGGVTLKSRTATGPAPSGEPKRSRHCRMPCMAWCISSMRMGRGRSNHHDGRRDVEFHLLVAFVGLRLGKSHRSMRLSFEMHSVRTSPEPGCLSRARLRQRRGAPDRRSLRPPLRVDTCPLQHSRRSRAGAM